MLVVLQRKDSDALFRGFLRLCLSAGVKLTKRSTQLGVQEQSGPLELNIISLGLQWLILVQPNIMLEPKLLGDMSSKSSNGSSTRPPLKVAGKAWDHGPHLAAFRADGCATVGLSGVWIRRQCVLFHLASSRSCWLSVGFQHIKKKKKDLDYVSVLLIIFFTKLAHCVVFEVFVFPSDIHR